MRIAEKRSTQMHFARGSLYKGSVMTGFSIEGFLQDDRLKIINEWVGKIQSEISDRYARRPREELLGTTSEAFEGYFHALVKGDYSYIDRFIDKITLIRLEAGFPLSDVQKAFELYGSTVITLLAQEAKIKTIVDCYDNIININRCVGHTIRRFSAHFQAMHERKARLSVLGEAVAHITHEIKNPLMLIGGFSNQILTALKDQDEKIVKKIQTIIQEVARLEDFLKDIGRFAKDVQPNRRIVHLNQMVEQVTGLFESEFAAIGIEVNVNLSPDCRNIVADAHQMEQVLLNLIKNGIEAMPEGGTLSIKSYLRNRYVCIEIADSGIGISKEDMEKISTPFFTTRKQGTGLGLSICKKIMDAHQGSLTVFSEGPGMGAAATIQIPVDEDLASG
jgi:signal transduction histidine kinase